MIEEITALDLNYFCKGKKADYCKLWNEKSIVTDDLLKALVMEDILCSYDTEPGQLQMFSYAYNEKTIVGTLIWRENYSGYVDDLINITIK